MAAKDFLGHGALNLDLIYEIESLDILKAAGFVLAPGREITGGHEDAERLIRLLETCARPVARSGGGSSANTISALARLGFSAAFLGCVGSDEAGGFILDSMKGVDTSRVARAGKSAVCMVILEQGSRDRAMMVVPHDREQVLVEQDTLSLLRDARCLHLSSAVTDKGLEGQAGLAGLLRPDQILSFDPGEIYASRGLDGRILKILKRTDILFITETELAMFTGKPASGAVEDMLLLMDQDIVKIKGYHLFEEAGGPVMVLKRGSRGASVCSARLSVSMPAEPVSHVVDNTGAGDAFNAGFLAGLFNGKGAADCLRQGAWLAARSLSAFGRDWIRDLCQDQLHSGDLARHESHND
ncbi:MAG: PfkB family carbohydrate kinase [Desulfobacteraceae bacterium]|nr:PfkB family carbohydrate kinase [Desulfobacteraceae bacterium]